MGFGDILGQIGSTIGAEVGMSETEGEKKKILALLYDQLGGASGLSPDKLEKTSFSGLKEDPKTRAMLMQALSQLGGIASAGGNDAQAVAANAQAQREAAGYEQAQRGAIQQNLAARGMGNSGAAISGLLAGQQAGANRVAAAATDNSANAQKRKMDALAAMASLGSAVRGQDYGMASDRARAEDEAKRASFAGSLQKLDAMGKARGGVGNYYAADRAEHINHAASIGQAIGGGIGGAGDLAGGNLSAAGPDVWTPKKKMVY